MQALHTTALAVDAALLSLIWIVQAVVYPSFGHLSETTFRTWHKSYTERMGYIAAPIMIAQLGLSLGLLFTHGGIANLLYTAGVVATWIVTFLISVPLHRRLESEGNRNDIVDRLVRTNWIRTVLWTLVFAHSLAHSLVR